MTSIVHAEPLPLQASTAWAWLLELAEAVAKAMRLHRPLTPQEARLYAQVEDWGAQVLDAQDVADLHARIYTIARDPQLIAWEFASFSMLDLRELPAPAELERAFVRLFGSTRLAQTCASLLAARISVVAKLAKDLEGLQLAKDAAETLSHVLADFRTPPILRSLFDETLAGEVALLALLAPLMDPERWLCPPWLRLALLEQVRLGSTSHLRLMSILPNVIIPEDLLPSDERLDQRALDREFSELARHVLPAELVVGEGHVDQLCDLLEGDSPIPPSVRAIFVD